MTAKNPNTFYACINQNQAVCPPEVQRQSVCIHADIGAVTRRRRTDHFYDRSMTALLELLKNADPEVKAQLRLALLT